MVQDCRFTFRKTFHCRPEIFFVKHETGPAVNRASGLPNRLCPLSVPTVRIEDAEVGLPVFHIGVHRQ